ncbi:interleukin 17-like protein [Octopus bimaculoides]|uniref:Interleukin 17-like protein n=1 Tax=Octopus bimaculoides TaxID=37653 RepID=A0A0L8HUA7_OCTBM|nr:interleukin 17-like protein [Octopus bimaculoides]|eukprot:XP_014769337.1 PREDICTED: interleukin 17-like protein [Octopus bimaculoides]
MKIIQFLFKVAIFLFNFTSIVSSAAIPTQCEIPTSLKVQYESLSSAAIGNNFFLPAEMSPAGSKQSLIDGNKTCPTSTASTDSIRERSTCPWYLNITHDSTIFPPSRTEVVCRCTKCLDTDNSNHQCVMVYTPMTVLKRTGECVDGLYVYKPSVIHVATACACARKVDVIKKEIEPEYET